MADTIETVEDWLKIEVGSQTPPDFKTHLNYVTQMKELSENLEIKLNLQFKSKSKFPKIVLSKKINLTKLIKESLDEEYKKASKEKDFAKVCSMWISVKSYYLIFNLLLILCTLVNDSKNCLDYSHSRTIKDFREMIKNKGILFNKDSFNKISTCLDAIKFKSKSGDALRGKIDEELRINSILKKLCKYKFDDFCRSEGLRDFRKKVNRRKRDDFFKATEISLFEFFYWYRIKTNYRDLAFLDQEVYSGAIVQFYENYYLFTINFYNALKKLINEISQKRLGENVLD